MCVISVASDGLEAVLKTEALQPDLILLDVGLPKLNGIEAARRIRNTAPESKILFLSQESDLAVARAALSVGGHGYVVKSDAENELIAAIEAVLKGKRYLSRKLAGHSFDSLGNLPAARRLRREEATAGAPSLTGESGHHHAVQFYDDEASFVDGFTPFVSATLSAGNAVIVMATKPHRDRLVQRLQAQGFDISSAINQGRYIALDAAETLSTFMVNDLPDPLRFFKITGDLIVTAYQATKGEHPRVAFCGECAPLLWAEGRAEAAIQLEHLSGELANTYEVDILCGYVMKSFQREPERHVYEKICAEHSGVCSEWAGY